MVKPSEAEKRIATALSKGAIQLDLSRLQLTTLPKSLGRLTQLRRLFVWGNQLTTLPEALGKLTQLQHFDASFNQLTVLPETLSQLRACLKLSS